MLDLMRACMVYGLLRPQFHTHMHCALVAKTVPSCRVTKSNLTKVCVGCLRQTTLHACSATNPTPAPQAPQFKPLGKLPDLEVVEAKSGRIPGLGRLKRDSFWPYATCHSRNSHSATVLFWTAHRSKAFLSTLHLHYSIHCYTLLDRFCFWFNKLPSGAFPQS